MSYERLTTRSTARPGYGVDGGYEAFGGRYMRRGWMGLAARGTR